MNALIRGIIVAGFAALGAYSGHYLNEYYPPVTISIRKYFDPNYDKDSPYARYTAIISGAGMGGLIGIILTELGKRQ